MATLTEIVGVYDADGGVRGETAYVIGHLLGRAHCALCDVTHSPLRRKPEWDRVVAELGLRATLLHRNELTPEVADAVRGHDLALVMARVDGTLEVALSAADLDVLDGSVGAFTRALVARAAERGWALPTDRSGGA